MWAEFAPAKINLTLELTGSRADGYHTIESLIVFASVGDRVIAEAADESSLSISGIFAPGLKDPVEDNLVWKALQAVQKACGKSLNIRTMLEKNLPIASGIGGGSADAAAMLRILERVVGKQVESNCFEGVALLLGADVPVCYGSKSMWVSGIGEVLHPVRQVPPYGILLVNPLRALPTKDVFAARKGPFAAPSGLPREMGKAAFEQYLLSHTNMLETAAISLMPEIGGIIDSIRDTAGCILSRMSGSGATCFGLYESKAQAEVAAKAISKAYPSYWVTPAQLMT